jgi:spermidine/putrescine transport system substrate-binding protein
MKKMLTKLLVIAFSLVMVTGCFSGCTKRGDILKVYNWGDYIDESVIDDFEAYFEAETGKKIKVEYSTFDGNETLYNGLKLGGDWDVVCPSDYMIDKLIAENRLKELEQETIDLYYDEVLGVGNPRIKELMSTYVDPDKKYAVPYIWGTFGIMYDINKIPSDKVALLDSWAGLWSTEFKGEVYMKDQVRDSYTVAMLYHYRDDLKSASNDFTDYTTESYQTLIKKIFQVYNDEELNKGKAALIKQRTDGVRKIFETDNGKFELAADTPDSGSLGLFWSCDAGLVMADPEVGSKNLGYVVPKEGSNVWVDGWVIPSGAVNTTAANMWIRYMMDEEICRKNSEYAGSSGANDNTMQELKAEYEADDEFFAGPVDPAVFKKSFMEALFPSDETLSRCAVMTDFGEMYYAYSEMFRQITGS